MPGCEVESCEEVDKYEKCKRDELLVDGNQIERVRKSDGVGRRNEFPSSFGEPPKRSAVLESHCDDCFSVRRERKMVLEESCDFKRPPSAKSVIDKSVEKLNSDIPASSSSDDLTKDEVGPVRTIVAAGEFVEDVRSFTCLSHGSISMIGRRRAMEDAVTMLPGVLARDFMSYDFFGVYDGHGGSSVASACKDRLHHLLAKEVESRTSCGDEMDWKKVMTSCFLKMDEEVFEKQEDVESTEFKSLGSTAVVVILGKDEVVVANCGDSRAILYRDGVVVPLSRDHKPDLPDERERVEAAGGRVINWNGSRVQGVLATSRSIGDHYLKPYVISEPEVTIIERTELDDFLIIASDGLWDMISNEVACEVVQKCLKCKNFSAIRNGNFAAEAASIIAELAIARGSKDNISVIVVELRKLSCTSSS